MKQICECGREFEKTAPHVKRCKLCQRRVNAERTEESSQRRTRRKKLWVNKYGWKFP